MQQAPELATRDQPRLTATRRGHDGVEVEGEGAPPHKRHRPNPDRTDQPTAQSGPAWHAATPTHYFSSAFDSDSNARSVPRPDPPDRSSSAAVGAMVQISSLAPPSPKSCDVCEYMRQTTSRRPLLCERLQKMYEAREVALEALEMDGDEEESRRAELEDVGTHIVLQSMVWDVELTCNVDVVCDLALSLLNPGTYEEHRSRCDWVARKIPKLLPAVCRLFTSGLRKLKLGASSAPGLPAGYLLCTLLGYKKNVLACTNRSVWDDPGVSRTEFGSQVYISRTEFDSQVSIWTSALAPNSPMPGDWMENVIDVASCFLLAKDRGNALLNRPFWLKGLADLTCRLTTEATTIHDLAPTKRAMCIQEAMLAHTSVWPMELADIVGEYCGDDILLHRLAIVIRDCVGQSQHRSPYDVITMTIFIQSVLALWQRETLLLDVMEQVACALQSYILYWLRGPIPTDLSRTIMTIDFLDNSKSDIPNPIRLLLNRIRDDDLHAVPVLWTVLSSCFGHNRNRSIISPSSQLAAKKMAILLACDIVDQIILRPELLQPKIKQQEKIHRRPANTDKRLENALDFLCKCATDELSGPWKMSNRLCERFASWIVSPKSIPNAFKRGVDLITQALAGAKTEYINSLLTDPHLQLWKLVLELGSRWMAARLQSNQTNTRHEKSSPDSASAAEDGDDNAEANKVIRFPRNYCSLIRTLWASGRRDDNNPFVNTHHDQVRPLVQGQGMIIVLHALAK
jgi:hypothetical protein